MDYRRLVRAQFAGGTEPDADVIEELAQHAAAVYQAARAEGCEPEEAARRLEEQLAAWARSAAVLRRPTRARTTLPPPPVVAAGPAAWGASLWADARYAARLLVRERGHAALMVATLALGIASATVLFSAAYGVLARPLPWPESERLVRIMESREGGAPRVAGTMSNGPYLAWRERPATIEGIGAWRNMAMSLTGAGDPVRLRVAAITASLFGVLRQPPAVGRPFGADDEAEGQVVILSHGLWHERFGGRADVVGRTLTLDGRPHTIVGIMGPEFAFPAPECRAWVPFRVPTVVGDQGMRRMAIFPAIARLRAGVTAEQASAEATARARTAPDPGLAAMALFGSRGPVELRVVGAIDAMTEDVRPALLVLLAATGLLLAAAAGNIASLQLARVTTRRRELAIRAAIGAGAHRLGRQLLVENLLIGVLGGLAGVVLARLLLQLVPAVLPADFPRAEAIVLDTPVLLFATALALAVSLACGLLPALHARRVNLVESLADDHLAPVGSGFRSRTARARAAIIVGQVAVACVLLVGAALLARSFIGLMNADRGYDPSNLLTARLPLPPGYPAERRTQLLQRLVERLNALPGVTHAAFADALPLTNLGGYSAFTMRSPGDPSREIQVEAAQRVVSPAYFPALRLRLVEGRVLGERDNHLSRPVIVVNRSFARRYLPGRTIGAMVPWSRGYVGAPDKRVDWEVVGVVDDVRQAGPDAPPQPEIFAAYAQLHESGLKGFDPVLVARSSGDPSRHVVAMRALLRETDPLLAFDSVMTMDERLAISLASPRAYAALVGGFAVLALLVAGVGLFGVLAYSVARRSREIGIRSALGATPGSLVALVVRSAVGLSIAGVFVGLAAASAGARWLSSLLYGVSPRDPLTFAAVPILVLLVAVAAAVVPGRRAAAVDPLQVLK